MLALNKDHACFNGGETFAQEGHEHWNKPFNKYTFEDNKTEICNYSLCHLAFSITLFLFLILSLLVCFTLHSSCYKILCSQADRRQRCQSGRKLPPPKNISSTFLCLYLIFLENLGIFFLKNSGNIFLENFWKYFSWKSQNIFSSPSPGNLIKLDILPHIKHQTALQPLHIIRKGKLSNRNGPCIWHLFHGEILAQFIKVLKKSLNNKSVPTINHYQRSFCMNWETICLSFSTFFEIFGTRPIQNHLLVF